MQTRTKIQTEQLTVFKNFISHVISEYKNDIVQSKFSAKFIDDLIHKKPKEDEKLNSYVKILKNIIRTTQKELSYEIEHDIIADFVIEYFKNSDKRPILSRNFLEKTFDSLNKFLENDSRYLYYFSTIHNFKLNTDEITINGSTKIRKITENEKRRILSINNNALTIQRNLERSSYIIVTKLEKTNHSSNYKQSAKQIISNTISLLKIFTYGDVKAGGLYSSRFSEKWNPRSIMDKIIYEPVEIYSENSYNLDDPFSFQNFVKKMNKCFPHVKDRYFFDNTIRRFSSATNQKNKTDELVDFVIALESILVPEKIAGTTARLSHRTATIGGKTDKEMLEILEFIPAVYDLRSGLVHGDSDRTLKINGKIMKLEHASQKMENLTRVIIKKMMIFSQTKENFDKNQGAILKKIDQMVYKREYLEKFRKITTLD